MKKLLSTLSVACALLAFVLVSGCSKNTQNLGTDYYADDMYKMVPKDKHKKHFPLGHQHSSGDNKEKRCYYEKGTPAYFCQYFDPWDE